MKNEQMNNQNGKQDQSVKKTNLPTEADQQKKQDDWTHKSTGKNQPVQNSNQSSLGQSQTSGNEKSNITVDNEGKIGKAHDNWQTGDANSSNGTQKNNQPQDNQQPKDSAVTDPANTAKKIPQQGPNK